MASGIDGQSGTMVKPLHAGLAAGSGVRAALLAADGFTATDAAFDGKRSFFAAFFPAVAPQTWRLTSSLGTTWYPLSPGIGIKMYPAGYYMHQSFEAAPSASSLAKTSPPATSRRSASRCRESGSTGSSPAPSSTRSSACSTWRSWRCSTVGSRRTSLPRRSCSADQVQDLLARTTAYTEAKLPDNPDIANNPVTIACRDGREFTLTVTMPQSHWNYPLPRDAWIGKFRANAATALPGPAVDGLIDAFDHLEDAPDVTRIAALLRTVRPQPGRPS